MKKLIVVLLVIIMTCGLGVNAFAVSDSVYREVLNDINDEYDLEIGYVEVDASKVTLEEYESKVMEVAIQQRELLDYIASKEATKTKGDAIVPYSSEVKTRTKPSWTLGNYFTITATYTVYNGRSVSLCRDAKINRTWVADYAKAYLVNVSDPQYDLIDSRRTTTVRYTARIYFDTPIVLDNIVLYTEFYFDTP